MEYKVEIANRYTSAFKLQGTGVYLPFLTRKDTPEDEGSFKDAELSEGTLSNLNDTVKEKSHFGHPVFDTITVRSISLQEGYKFPHDPLVDFKYMKKITETPMDNGDTVVEMAGVAPVAITLRVILWNPEGSYPYEQLEEFLNMFRINETLEVDSELFNAHNLSTIYVKSADLAAVEGFEDTQAVIVSAMSMKDPVLEILESDLQ